MRLSVPEVPGMYAEYLSYRYPKVRVEQ